MALILTVCCGFQSSFWFQVTDGAPCPQLWLLVLLYISLYRPYFAAMGLIYFLAFILKSFSTVPLGLLWSCFFILGSLSYFVKSRFFWSSTRYFIIASTVFSITFNILFYTLSHLLEENPASLSLFTRFNEIILTTLFSAPVYWLLIFVDRLTLPEVMEIQGVTD